MKRALVLVAALAACMPKGGGGMGGGGSRGVVSYGGSSSGSYSSSSSSSAPASYGSSSDTQVYRSTATGGRVAASSSAVEEQKQTESGGLAQNKLFRAGVTVLAISYVSTVVTGQVVENTLFGDFERSLGAEGTVDRMWIPVIGAWSALLYNEDTVRSNCNSMTGFGGPWYGIKNCNLMDASSIAVFFGALAQTTGLALTVGGLLRPPKFHPKHDEKRLVIVPHGNAGGAGVVLSGSF